MTRVALISDTHAHVGDDVINHLKQHDEIWHAGDIGLLSTYEQLESLGLPIRAVYGNIDGHELRSFLPLDLSFFCEGVAVFMTHIGGYPKRYKPRVREILLEKKPKLYICGHSHILKVIYDNTMDVLHMNPGACGKHGFHAIRTMLSFEIDGSNIKNAKVIELGKRGVL